jgi:branched-chain amino acid transport system substrate-binding protein
MRKVLQGLAVAAAAWTITAPLSAAEWPASVKIGGLLPLTGNAGFLGEEIRQGLDIFAKQKAGNGVGLALTYVDSQADPRIGFQGYQRLSTRDGVEVIVLTYTNVAIAVAAQANRAGTAMFNMTQGAVTDLGKNFTSSIPSFPNQAAVAIKDATDKGIKKVATIYENTESIVRLNRQIADEFCPKYGCEVVAAEQIPSGGTDVAAQVTAAIGKSPDAIIALGVATQLIPIMRELKTRAFAGKVISVSEMDNLLSSGNAALAEGATYSLPSPQKEGAAYKRFAEAYRATYKREAPLWAAQGFQAGEIVGAVVDKLKTDGKDWSAANFVTELKSGKFSTIFGEVNFGTDGRIRQPLSLVTIRDGQRQLVRVVAPEELQ